ncbi:calcium/sodium antiporter [Desulforamulus aquiferis]|uniref:Calcium/sodium antiporter n=1 Tax=Desulforamulus aquiferis TaxID=1397668 RepID=A0AAW7ZE11_9FIRM|nr:calcium/sodium antiporter [Desulforamulus aquiferis]MDO7787495.1 calcium/sodium antiporter [Desulforamulus aquiferis]
MAYVLLLIGLILLIKSADYFITGASGIAKLLRIPPMLIGLTIVAFGTSSPEAAVSINASLKGVTGITLGNVIGSNIINIAFIIGLTAIISPLRVERETIKKEIPFTLLASIAVYILIADKSLQALNENIVSRADGLILFLFFLIFLYYLFEIALNSRENLSGENELTPDSKPMGLNVFYAVGGMVGIILGANLVVKGSTSIALQLGMSETLVGLTIIAFGTSLPELITSITAALKKESEIAIGNIVGSNIFNILFILSISSVITPLTVEDKYLFDAIIMIIYTLILFFFSLTHHRVNRVEGIILSASYIGYVGYIILRN